MTFITRDFLQESAAEIHIDPLGILRIGVYGEDRIPLIRADDQLEIMDFIRFVRRDDIRVKSSHMRIMQDVRKDEKNRLRIDGESVN